MSRVGDISSASVWWSVLVQLVRVRGGALPRFLPLGTKPLVPLGRSYGYNLCFSLLDFGVSAAVQRPVVLSLSGPDIWVGHPALVPESGLAGLFLEATILLAAFLATRKFRRGSRRELKSKIVEVSNSEVNPEKKVERVRELVMDSFAYGVDPGEGYGEMVHLAFTFLDDEFPTRGVEEVLADIQRIISEEF
ncbi:MAG: hypothetical protein ACTSU5_06250 [Promethearchaeota archaeon]